MAHIFITGGTGFLGTHIVRQLAAQGHHITALVRSHSRFTKLVQQLGEETSRFLSAVSGDLTQPGLGLSSSDRLAIQAAEVIIHAGGPMDILLNEQLAKQVFLDAAVYLGEFADELYKHGVLRHFIHVVGFKSPVTDQNWHEPSAIMKLLEHESPYERMKITADLHIRKQAKESGYPLSVVHPSVVIGDSATGNTEQTGGLGILIASARRKLMGTVPGGRKHWLPLVHVDHAAAFIAALANERQPVNETYYLLDEQDRSHNMTELIRIINKELRVPAPIGSVSLSFLTKLFSTSLGSKAGIPKQSLSFIVNTDFPTESARRIQQKYSLPASMNATVLPHVIADLDYRLSHGGLVHAGFTRGKRGPIATMEKTGRGNPVLLLPGTFSGADCLLPLASELHEHNVWVADLPGFGRTPNYRHDANVIEGHIHAIIAAVLSQAEPVTLIGHSYGALLAAQVMERIPERIHAVHLLQPAFHQTNGRYRIPSVNRLLLTKVSANTLRDKLLSQGCFESVQEIPAGYMQYVRNELRSPRVRAALADTLAALTKAKHFKLQPASWHNKPVTIIWGTHDQVYSLPEAYDQIPAKRIAHGHHFPISHPAETAELIRQAGLSVSM